MIEARFAVIDSVMSSARALWKNACTRVLKSSENVRSRYVWQSFDAVLTARLKHSSNGEPVACLIDAGPRRYRRLQEVTNALTRLAPGIVEDCRRRLFEPGLLPFACTSVELLSFGSGATVFVVRVASDQQPGEKHVLKIFRRSLGRRLDTVLHVVQERRAVYDRLAAWYGDCGVVLPTQFLLLHGPLLSGAAAASVQPYVEGKHTDVFHDLSEQELMALLATRPRLAAQFRAFVERTLRAAEREAACVDIVGRNNLVITGTGQECRLVLLDNGIYDFAYKATRSPASLAELEHRLAYLRRLCEQLPARSARDGRGPLVNVANGSSVNRR